MLWLQIAILLLLIVLIAVATLLFVRWRTTPFHPYYSPEWQERYFHRSWSYPLFEIIERAQEEVGVRLTWGAREMLAIPVIETIEARGDVNWPEVDASIRDVIRTMAEENGPNDTSRTRNSVAAIRAFWRRFCNIPPFCSRREG